MYVNSGSDNYFNFRYNILYVQTNEKFKQQISDAECKEILKNEKRGVLSLLGDDGYPYGLPLSHLYSEEDNKIYFHGAKEGHKIDAIKNYEKASFCVYDSGYRKEDDWALNINSVIVFGKIRLVTAPDLTRQICTKLVQKFTDDQEYLEKELKNALPHVQCLELEIEHMTGKLVNES